MAIVTKYCTFSEFETGKGFITHEESALMQFSVITTIARIYGEEDDVDTWISKVHGTLSDKATYDAAKAAKSSMEQTVDAIKTKVDAIDTITKTIDTTTKTISTTCDRIETDVKP